MSYKYSIIDETLPNPLVVVAMLTYNHAQFIQEAIDSVLMQQTSFPIKLVIAEDCSTDNTREIILDYQKKHPKIIKLILQNKNVGAQNNNIDLLSNLEGKYIAALEGDDYWTDPHKLQKQVDFLETNEEYGLVSGGYVSINTITAKKVDCIKSAPNKVQKTADGFDVTLEHSLNDLYVPTMTAVFRRELLDIRDWNRYRYFCDAHLFYLLLSKRKGFYMQEILGAYHIHDGGIYSNTGDLKRRRFEYNVFSELYREHPNDKYLRKTLFNRSLLYYTTLNSSDSKYDDMNQYRLLLSLIPLVQSPDDMKRLLIAASGRPGRFLIDSVKKFLKIH